MIARNGNFDSLKHTVIHNNKTCPSSCPHTTRSWRPPYSVNRTRAHSFVSAEIFKPNVLVCSYITTVSDNNNNQNTSFTEEKTDRIVRSDDESDKNESSFVFMSRAFWSVQCEDNAVFFAKDQRQSGQRHAHLHQFEYLRWTFGGGMYE